MYGIFPSRQVHKYNFYRVSHLGLYHWSHDSQMLFFFGSLFLFGKGGVSVLPVNCLFVFAADKMRAWYRVTRGMPVKDQFKITL